MKPSEKKYLYASIGLHAALFLVLTVKVMLFPAERQEWVRAVRVDFVALPDKDPVEGPEGEEKPVEKPPPAAPEKKKEEVVNIPDKKLSDKVSKKDKKPEEKKDNIKDKQSDAIQRLATAAKIKKMKEAKKDAPEGAQYKGNQLSKGNSLTGVEKIQDGQYLDKLYAHTKRNWQLPEWLTQQNLTAFVLIRIDENGNILEKRFTKASGNRDFDNETMQAITASAPLPAPPENLVSYYKSYGIELRFPE